MERDARLGVVRLPGRPGARARSDSGPTTLLAAVLGQAFYLFPWIWAGAGGDPASAGSAGSAATSARPIGSCSARRSSRWRCSRGGVHAAGPAALDARRLPVALPHAGPVVAAALGDSTAVPAAAGPDGSRDAAGDRSSGCCRPTGDWSRKGARARLGLLRVSRDPTLDMYGWDQVAAELKQRGLLDRPGTFLFTSTWYHSGHLAFAIRGSTTPVLCYNPWDARSFAFWSRSDDWVGRRRHPRLAQRPPGRAALLRPLVPPDRADRRLRGDPGRRPGPPGPALPLRPADSTPSRSTPRRASARDARVIGRSPTVRGGRDRDERPSAIAEPPSDFAAAGRFRVVACAGVGRIRMRAGRRSRSVPGGATVPAIARREGRETCR